MSADHHRAAPRTKAVNSIGTSMLPVKLTTGDDCDSCWGGGVHTALQRGYILLCGICHQAGAEAGRFVSAS